MSKAKQPAPPQQESQPNEEQQPAPPQQESPAPAPAQQQKARYIVLVEFGDRADFRKKHKEGDDVSHFDADRLAHLVSIGCVEKR